MAVAQVMNLAAVCQSLPPEPECMIWRDNFLDTINLCFQGDTRFFFIDGEEGVGKTTLLTQFVLRHPDNAIGLFINPINKWSCDPIMLRIDLCSQIYYALHKEVLAKIEDIDESLLNLNIYHLRRQARLNRDVYYFVIDGLHELDRQLRDLIINMLPLDCPNFLFLFSGDSSLIPNVTKIGGLIKTCQLTVFTIDETAHYLNDIIVNKDDIEDFHKICRGIPGRLACIRRCLKAGIDTSRLIAEMPDDFRAVLECEWSNVDMSNDLQIKILAMIAHDHRQHTLDSLASLFETEPTVISQQLEKLTFIKVDETNVVSYVSNSFRSFAACKLTHLKAAVTNTAIQYLLKWPKTEDSLKYLPEYLEQAGRFDDLLNYLSAENLAEMIASSQSIGPLKKTAEIGLKVAERMHRIEQLVRFSMKRAIIEELANLHIQRSELEALIAIGNHSAAIALAQSAVLQEDRLHMLAITAKSLKLKGLGLDIDVVHQIRQLYGEIDYTTLGERAFDIASDLIYSCPDIASDLIEKAVRNSTDYDNIDWVYATLSLAAIDANNKENHLRETVRALERRISDPLIRKFWTEVSLWLLDYSAQEIIAEVDKIENITDRLDILRIWTKRNTRKNDADLVLEYALQLVIGTTAYAPNARVLRELAEPLPYITNESQARKLANIFDAQKEAIRRLGPTEDFVRLQLILAQTESKYDFKNCHKRLIDIYYYVAELSDLAVKASAFAWFVALLPKIDHQRLLEKSEGLHSLTSQELDQYLRQLLEVTADHYAATRNIIRALSITEPERALQVIKELNTEHRRNKALYDLISHCIHVSDEQLNLGFIRQQLTNFTDTELRDKSLLFILEKISRLNKPKSRLADEVVPFLPMINLIEDAGKRCRAYCTAYRLISLVVKYDELSKDILAKLYLSWESIDVPWRKSDIGFRIATDLAPCSPQVAQDWINRTEKYKEDTVFSVTMTSLTYIRCLRLAIRALSGLFTKRVDKPEDIAKLAKAIDRLPSYGERAKLWAELALRYYAAGRSDDCRNIVIQYLKPLLRDISTIDKNYINEIIIIVSPALYCAHKLTALDQIAELAPERRDHAYYEICQFLLTKLPPGEPSDLYAESFWEAEYEDLIDVCEIINLMSYDTAIHNLIRNIAACICPRRRRHDYSQQQKLDIAMRLQNTINAKLPDHRNIRHLGYKIASEAELARIEQASTQKWIKIINDARNIPNLADKALVLSMIAMAMPSKEHARKNELLAESMIIIEQIPVILDKVEHYEWIALNAHTFDRSTSKKCLAMAIEFAMQNEEPDSSRILQRIIDCAYRIDPDFAASLASVADDDPARAYAKEVLYNRLNSLNLKKQMVNGRVHDQGLKKNYPQAAWMALGALNAQRAQAVPLENVAAFFRVAASLPLAKSYPIFAWLIENARRRLAGTDQAETIIRLIFEAVMLSVEFAGSLADKSVSQLNHAKRGIVRSVDTSSLVINPGERRKAIEFIKDWICQEVRDYLKVYDPYFGPQDLELLQVVRSVKPTCRIQILTSRKHQNQECVPEPWKDSYMNYWRDNISEQDPPDTEITIVGTKQGGDAPIHDRWWLANGSGIRTGNSFHALGVGKITEIEILSKDEAITREEVVDRYLFRQVREYKGQRLIYEQFTLE